MVSARRAAAILVVAAIPAVSSMATAQPRTATVEAQAVVTAARVSADWTFRNKWSPKITHDRGDVVRWSGAVWLATRDIRRGAGPLCARLGGTRRERVRGTDGPPGCDRAHWKCWGARPDRPARAGRRDGSHRPGWGGGANGAAGAPGPTGEPGPTGADGALQAPRARQVPRGRPIGATSPAGATGPTGVTGAVGAPRPTGANGPTGAAGAQGDRILAGNIDFIDPAETTGFFGLGGTS